jgi:TP901 family phage tail tape measure protein
MANQRGNRELGYTFKISVEEAIKQVALLKQRMKEARDEATKVGPAGTSKGFDSKPLTEYQAGIIAIKQAQIELAKQKQDQAAADRSASLALQGALRDEANTRRVNAAQEKKDKQDAILLAKQLADEANKRKPTQFSNSQAEIDAYKNAQRGSMLYTSAINAEIVAKARLNAESVKQAVANGGLTPVINSNTNAYQQQTTVTNKVTLSKQQLAQMLAEEKYRQQQATAELKNNSREMLNAKGSIEQRRAALIRLTTVYDRLSKAERDSSSGVRMQGVLKGLTNQITELEKATGRSQRSVGGYAEGISAFFSSIKSNILTTLGPLALLTAAWAAAKAAFSHNVEISDSFVDVQRTAKLSADQVDDLGEKLKKINTRTSLEGLLDIGFIGGRLGVAKDDLVSFITTVDQLSVVLKKEFPGGADAVATALGKIITVYKITQKEGISLEQALKNTGSTFLELAHNGQVTVQYLQDFSLRTAGVAQIAKISLPTMLAYGAVLSQAGITAQVAGSSVTRLISSLSTKRDKYFAIAQLADSALTIEKFTNLINTDTKSALELFFKGLKAGNPTQTEFGDRLKTLALTTGAAKNAVIALAENQELLFEKTKIANKANEEGTSVAHNFELANNSLAASFEKIANRISNNFVSSSTARGLAELLNSLTDNKTEAENLADSFVRNTGTYAVLVQALNPLLQKYDELKGRTILTKDQQFQLKTVTGQLGDLMPSVITKFDDYGNALDINRGKIHEYTEAQATLLELQNRSALKKANTQFEDAYFNNLPKAKEQAARAATLKQNGIDRFLDFFQGGDSDAEAKQRARDKITRVSGEAYEAAKAIRTLGGELTKTQQDIIDYYEVLNKPKQGKKTPATVIGDGSNEDLVTDTGRTVDDIKADIKRVTELKKPLDVASKQYKDYVEQLKGFKKELKLANGGVDSDVNKAENQYKSALNSRNTLQKSINDLVKKGTDKQLSAEEQELASVKKKYADKLAEAKKFNDAQAKIDEENRKKGLKVTPIRVNISGLDRAQSNEIAAITDKQETEKLKVTLDAQKKLYDDFENYKAQVGEEKAKEKYGKELNNYDTYLDALQARRDALANGDDKAKGGSDVDKAAVQQRLKLLDEQITIETALKEKKDAEAYAAAYNAAMTHAQALIKIDSEYLAARNALQIDAEKNGKAVGQEEIDNLERIRQQKIQSENETNLNIATGWEHLFDNFDKMSRASILKRLRDAKKVVEAAAGKPTDQGGISQEDADGKINQLNSAIAAIDGTSSFASVGEKLKKLFKIIKEGGTGTEEAKGALRAFLSDFSGLTASLSADVGKLGDALGKAGIGGEGLQDAFKGIQGVLGGAGQLADGIISGNPVDIIAGSINFLSSAISLFDHKDKDLEKKIQKYQKELNDLGQAYKQLERDVQRSVGNEYYTNSAKEIENLQKQQAKLTQMRDAEVDKKKTDQAKVDAFNDQISDIPNKIEDIRQSMIDMLVQTNFKDLSSDLADVFTTAFGAGENALDSLNSAFNKVIANAAKKGLELKFLQPAVDSFINDFADYMKDNDSSPVGFNFQKYKDLLQAAGEQFTAGLEPLKDFFSDTSANTDSALKQSIKGITSDQASAIEGPLRGTYDNTKQLVVLNTQRNTILLTGNNTMSNIFNVAVSSLAYHQQIAQNTFDTVEELKKVVIEVKGINTNTKGGIGLRGMGLGS